LNFSKFEISEKDKIENACKKNEMNYLLRGKQAIFSSTQQVHLQNCPGKNLHLTERKVGVNVFSLF